jgi:hypothetical protein
VRRRIAELVRVTGVAPEDADEARKAEELLIRSGGELPSEVAAALSRLAALRERRAEADASIAAGDERLVRESARLQRLLLGDEREGVRRELERAMVREFRREQDRIATDRGHGVAPRSADERRARLSAAVSYESLDYPRLLRATGALRKVDRHRLLAEHRRHRADVRRDHPDQPGPDAPAFDAEGYFARGLWFSGRDERVWVNLADQDRITQLYHAVMAKSLIRHDVMTWPYYAAYRAAGHASRDELHFATLRVGGPAGPLVAAVSVKRSIAGHFRPERIALNGIDFGAYHALVILTIANELRLGGTFCSLGQTSQGTKLRDFGASFIDAHEYTAFRGLTARVFGLDRARRATFAEVHIDRILEIAALPPEERAEASRRHGIRWHI